MKKSTNPNLKFLLGSTLIGTKPGHGSLNSIVLVNENDEEFVLWLYMADWAFTDKNNEIASSDIPKIGTTLDLSMYYGRKLLEIYEFPDTDEIHFEFEKEFQLEIWENIEAYGRENQEFFSIFQETGGFMHILSYPINKNSGKSN